MGILEGSFLYYSFLSIICTRVINRYLHSKYTSCCVLMFHTAVALLMFCHHFLTFSSYHCSLIMWQTNWNLNLKYKCVSCCFWLQHPIDVQPSTKCVVYFHYSCNCVRSMSGGLKWWEVNEENVAGANALTRRLLFVRAKVRWLPFMLSGLVLY